MFKDTWLDERTVSSYYTKGDCIMTRPLVKRIDMALHVQELCAEHDITVKYQSLNDTDPRYYANQDIS